MILAKRELEHALADGLTGDDESRRTAAVHYHAPRAVGKGNAARWRVPFRRRAGRSLPRAGRRRRGCFGFRVVRSASTAKRRIADP